MTSALSALQRSIFTVLSQDNDLANVLGSAKIFDRVPERVEPPYVVLGRSMVSDWSTSTDTGEAIVFFIHVWSQANSRTECNSIQAHIKRILAANIPPLDSQTLVALRFQLAENRRDRLTEHIHGVMRFRAVIEQAN